MPYAQDPDCPPGDFQVTLSLSASEDAVLTQGESGVCADCHVRGRLHTPGCPGLDVHPECPHCHNICGHRSAKCPGRYE